MSADADAADCVLRTSHYEVVLTPHVSLKTCADMTA